MSKIRLMLVALACAFTAFAAPEIQFLPYFDSLNAYRGRAGHWFVRDAAGTSTGQHGDPTVLKGWAMYTWNPLRSDGRAGWTKICEEESLDSSATEALLREYVKRDDFNAAMEAISKTYTTLEKHNTDVNALKSVCQSLKVTVQTMESDLTDVKSDVSKVITTVRKVSNDLAAHETWAKAASNNVLTAAMKYTDEKTKGGGGGGVDTNAVKTIAGELDNVVKTEVKSYTDEKVEESRAEIKDIIYSKSVAFGEGATNGESRARTVIVNPDGRYPSTVGNYGYNVVIGIDHEVGTKEKGRYSVAIGTSSKALGMHSYAWGSQINALMSNTTVMGYGLSATNEWSTVIGHGVRPVGMKFDTYGAMVAWLSNSANRNKLYVDMGFLIGDGPGSSYGITEVYMIPDPSTGMYCKLEKDPLDYKLGGRLWNYGKSHGPGTFNIVTVSPSDTKSRGLKSVFINDDDLYKLVFNSTDNSLHYLNCGFGQSYANTNSVTGVVKNNLKDHRIIIGENACVDGVDGDHSQSVAIGRNAETHGSASVAVGPNTEVDEGGFGVALGWRAIAAGEGGIAVGMGYKSSTNFWLDAKHQQRNPVADYTAAVAPKSIAIGRSAVVEKNATKGIAIGDRAHVDAVGSVQLGYGTNTTANSLRFQNVDVVKDGKVCGTFDSKDLDPKEVDVSEGAQTEEIVMKVTPHIINTLASTNVCGPGTEVYVESTGSRNYEIYVPNTKEFREGLPMTFDTEIADCKAVFVNGKNAFKLPCLIKVQQPTKNNVLFTAVEVDDGTDWTPAITNCNIYFDVMAGKFMTKKVGSTGYSLQGTSLQAGTEYKVEYPISATATWTNDFETVSAQQKFLSETCYSNVYSVELTPTKQVHFASDTSWFKVHYTTVNGKANVIQKTITIE